MSDRAEPEAGDGRGGAARTASRPLLLAHRGDHRRAPENSLEAFHAALAVPGIDGLEFDVRLSADRVAVLLHDETLARVHGRPDRADALTAQALAGLGVPSLEAALAAIPPSAFLDVELKEDAALEVVEALAQVRGDPPSRVVMSSFAVDILERVAALAPSWPRWLNADRLDDGAIRVALGLGCGGISARWDSIDATSTAMARSAGLDVAAWTVRSAEAVERLTALGVVAICVEGEALESLHAIEPAALPSR